MTIITRSIAALLASTALVSTALAHDTRERGKELFRPGLAHAATPAEGGPARVPLYTGLGLAHEGPAQTLEITTGSRAAQAYFDQGLRLAWAFNHAEARRSFQEAQRRDPGCAMCYWGEALVLGPNINDPMHAEAVAPANAALERAVALKAGTSAKEQALIDALSRRYAAEPPESRAPLDVAWAEAMREVAATWPDDAEVLTLFADALMNLQPWDYWEADRVTPKGHGGEIVATLERALAIDPDHPAAAHLYIHAVEASANPERAEAAADRLRGAMPAAGHLAHMPAHIYIRVGRFADSIAVNREAIAADEAFLAQAEEASDLYRFGYYPHNVHFLMMSAQMAGLAGDVIGAAEKLAAVTSDEVAQGLAWVQAIEAAPYGAHAQFSDPETILALPDPGDRLPFVKGFWHYARGVAFAASGVGGAASAELDALDRLIAEADLSDLEAQYLPARDVLGIARHVVAARIARAGQDPVAAEEHLRAAVALEDRLPYMEPPYWYYPVRQTLGAVLLDQGRAEEAMATFAEALEQTPRNGWALWGLMQAEAAAGAAERSATEAAFEKAWLGDRALLSLDRL